MKSNILKRIVAVLLCLVMSVMSLGITASAYSVYDTSINSYEDLNCAEDDCDCLEPDENIFKVVSPVSTSTVSSSYADVIKADSYQEVQKYYNDAGQTDGLPVIPPTTFKVEKFMRYTSHNDTDVVATIDRTNRKVTAYQVAVNAVMSGCSAEYMPICIAFVKAMDNEDYIDALADGSLTPMAFVNGPLARLLGVDNTQGMTTEECNIAIGRFIEFALINLAGIAQERSTSFGYMQPLVFSENDQACLNIGWEPYNVQAGYGLNDSTVTATAFSMWGNNVTPATDLAEEIMKVIAWDITEKELGGLGSANSDVYADTHRTVFITPQVASALSTLYKDKENLEDALIETARRPMWMRAYAYYYANTGGVLSGKSFNTVYDELVAETLEDAKLTDSPAWISGITDPEIVTGATMKKGNTIFLVTGDDSRNKTQVMPGCAGYTVECEVSDIYNDLVTSFVTNMPYLPIEDYYLTEVDDTVNQPTNIPSVLAAGTYRILDPSTGTTYLTRSGRVYYDSTTATLHYWDSTANAAASVVLDTTQYADFIAYLENLGPNSSFTVRSGKINAVTIRFSTNANKMNTNTVALDANSFNGVSLELHANTVEQSLTAGGPALDNTSVTLSSTITSFKVNLDSDTIVKGGTTTNGFVTLNGTTVTIDTTAPAGSTAIIGAANDDGTYRTMTFEMKSDGTYKVTYNTNGSLVIDATNYYLKGTFNNWEATDAFQKTSADGVYTLTKELAAGTYTFKIHNVPNDTWYANSGSFQDNADRWEMSSSVSDNCSMTATGGTYNFKFDTNSSKLTVTKAVDIGDLPTEDPSDSTGLSKEYSLVGYINGENKGCEGDENSAPYVFNSEGKVTVNFAVGSYVFVKTTDNADWFMSEKYTEETSAVLYNTDSGATEKMYVPAGTVTFTLKENLDGTVTLSYVVDSTDVTPILSDVVILGTFNNWNATPNMYIADGDIVTTTMELSAGTYEFKIIEDGSWLGNSGKIYDTTTTTSTSGWEMSSAVSADCKLIATGGTYTFNYNTSTNKLIVLHTPVETTPTETTPTETTPTETTPTETTPTIPTETTPVVPKEYSLVGYINGANVGCEDDFENDPYIFNEEGTVTVTFTSNSYVFVKVTDESDWFMTEALCTDTTATLKSTNDGAMEKMFVPAGIATFTLVENADGTLTLSYEIEVIETTPTETTPTETTPTETTPTETTPTETTPVVPKEYSLVGYINGANVGCEDDFENDPYIFNEDGTVTVTFTSNSYVFVKVTDESDWFMTEALCTDTTATLKSTNDGAMEKMFVPAGIATFTLVENADGTLTLSYEIEVIETTPTETETTPTEDTSPIVYTYPVKIVYHYNVYSAEDSGTFEYMDGYTVAAAYTADNLEITNDIVKDSESWRTFVASYAPTISNHYFDYELDLSSITLTDEYIDINNITNMGYYQFDVNFTETAHEYIAIVNGRKLSDTFHFQEIVDIDASTYLKPSNVYWYNMTNPDTAISTKTKYSFRITDNVELGVAENINNIDVEFTSVISNGYSELSYDENNTKKFHQNFYIQNFINIKDTSVKYLGSGVFYYAFNNDTGKPAKSTVTSTVLSNLGTYAKTFADKTEKSSGSNFIQNYKSTGLAYSYIPITDDWLDYDNLGLPTWDLYGSPVVDYRMSSGAKYHNDVIVRYSSSLTGFNYFFDAVNTYNSSLANLDYIVYSFFLYEDANGEVQVALSDKSASAPCYVSDSGILGQ